MAEIFGQEGIWLERTSNDRVAGWLDLKEWLKPTEHGPALKIHASCVNLIRCLPQLQYDQKRPNDVADEPHELTHGPDAIRCFVAGRPMPYKPKGQEPIAQWAHERKRSRGDVGSKIKVI